MKNEMDNRTLAAMNETFDRLDNLTEDELFSLLLKHCDDGIGRLLDYYVPSELEIMSTNLVSSDIESDLSLFDDFCAYSDPGENYVDPLFVEYFQFNYTEFYIETETATAANDENYAMAA
ncbi:MAG: hypothetical protein WBO26_18055 [Providencia rettgeri]